MCVALSEALIKMMPTVHAISRMRAASVFYRTENNQTSMYYSSLLRWLKPASAEVLTEKECMYMGTQRV